MNMEAISDRIFFIFSKSSRTQLVPQVDGQIELILVSLKIFIFNSGENRERDWFFPFMGPSFWLVRADRIFQPFALGFG